LKLNIFSILYIFQHAVNFDYVKYKLSDGVLKKNTQQKHTIFRVKAKPNIM